MESTRYYVSIENKMIEQTKMPGQAELEIYATSEEAKIIKGYMENKNKDVDNVEEDDVKISKKDSPSASYTPAVGNEERYDSDFDKLIDLVYKLGTEKTKQNLEQYR